MDLLVMGKARYQELAAQVAATTEAVNDLSGRLAQLAAELVLVVNRPSPEETLPGIIAPLKAALSDLAKAGTRREEAVKAVNVATTTLADRLSRLETTATGVEARLEATPVIQPETVAALHDALARIEQATAQRHDVFMTTSAALAERLERLEAATQQAAAANTVKPEAIAAVSDAVARIEQASTQRHDVSLAQVGALGQRLDRIEANVTTISAEQKQTPPARPEAVAAISDIVLRLEQASTQRHDAFITTSAALAERLERLEAATQQAAAANTVKPEAIAAVSDAVARIEQASTQRHDVSLAQVGALGQRLDRIEATSGARDQHTTEVVSSIFAALRQLQGNGTGVPIIDPSERLKLDFDADVDAVDPKLAKIVRGVTREITALNEKSDLIPLAKNSPALATFDWGNYLRLSEIRVAQVCAALKRRHARGRVLDMGSYFGNFSLSLQRAGWTALALDSYTTYGEAFARHRALMQNEGVQILDYQDVGFDLAGLEPESIDAIICMGVIEHVPHTPRLLLAAMDRVLKPGGVVAMDTPNLAYQFQRQRLAEGGTVFAPIETQFETAIPFEGHHREYTPDEMRWMMQRIGYQAIEIEMFNYSIYGLPEIQGSDLANFRAMEADPSRRELILVTANKPPEQSKHSAKKRTYARYCG